MAGDWPSLRTLYDEQFLIDLRPTGINHDEDDFRIGLRATNENFKLIEQMILLSFEQSGLSKYVKSLDDPVSLLNFNKAVVEPVQEIEKQFPEIPTWFITEWVESIIGTVWQTTIDIEAARIEDEVKNKAKAEAEAQRPRSAESLDTASERHILSVTESARPEDTTALADTICRMEMFAPKHFDPTADEQDKRIIEVPIEKACCRPEDAELASSYDYITFIEEFETVLWKVFRIQVNLLDGTIGYVNDDLRFKTIATQKGFQNALEYLYARRGNGSVLKFIHRKESAKERHARLDALNPGTTPNDPSPVATRFPRLVKETLQASLDRQRRNAEIRAAVAEDMAEFKEILASKKSGFAELEKKSASGSKFSPPATPAPAGPLPPVPTLSEERQLAEQALLGPHNIAYYENFLPGRDSDNAEQVQRDAVGTIRKTRKASSSAVAQNASKDAVEATQESTTMANAVVAPNTSKPLPPPPGRVDPRFANSTKALSHDVGTVHIYEQGGSAVGSETSIRSWKTAAVHPQKATSSQTGPAPSRSRSNRISSSQRPPIPPRSSSRDTSSSQQQSIRPTSKIPKSSPPKQDPTPKKPFLKRGGGISGIPGPSTPPNRITNASSPPKVVKQTRGAWGLGNKLNPSPTKASGKGKSAAATTKAAEAGIKRGGTAKVGQQVPSDNDADEEDSTDKLLPGQLTKPEFETWVKNLNAKRQPEFVTPKDGPSRNPSQRANTRPDDILILKSPSIHSKKRTSILSPGFSKIPEYAHRARKRLSKQMYTITTPKTPKTTRRLDSRDLDHVSVTEMIDQTPRAGEALTPPGTSEGLPRKSTSSITRIAEVIKDKEFHLSPGKKKNFVGVKIPKPKFVSKADRFANQDVRYRMMNHVKGIRTYRRGGDESVDDDTRSVDGSDDNTQGPDLEELDDVSDGEDESKSPADYMIEQFQKMQDMPELAQMYDHVDNPHPTQNDPWEECCKLFQIDPTRTSFDDKVTIAGLKTPIYQYQAFGVYWQMRNSRTIGGGFVADEMGLGKTLSFLAYIVVERQLGFLWREVETSQNNPWVAKSGGPAPPNHLKAGEAGPNAVCPDAGRYGPGWIACPCASPVTAAMAAKPGVRLAIVPPSLVPTWVEQWDTHIDVEDQILQMKLVIAHDGSQTATRDGKLDIRDGKHPTVNTRVKSERIKFTERDRSSTAHYYPDKAQIGQERVLVLTTRDHYIKTWATKFQYSTQVLPEDKNNNDEKDLVRGISPGVVYGIAMIDECHEDWQKGKGRSGIVANLPRAGRPFVWGYSGTPITTTPRSIEGILWAIESLWPKRDRTDKTTTGLEQEQDSNLWNYCWKTLDNVCLEFELAVKKESDNHIVFQDFQKRFKPFLTMLMIRRTADTTWFGHPLIKLKPHIHQDIIVRHNTLFDGKIDMCRLFVDKEIADKITELRKNWKSSDTKGTTPIPHKFSFNSELRLRYKQRLFATFPYLSELGQTHNPDHLDLTVEELKKFRGVDEKRNPYFKHLKGITENSPKLMWLYNFIAELDKTKDVNGDEQKIVIMSEFNQVAFILKLWIEKYIKDKTTRVGLIYAGQKPRDRKAIIEAFTDAIDPRTKTRLQKPNYQFLIGTTRIIGAGLQLTRAANVVLMEPHIEFHHELQGYARVHRIGQRNEVSRSYRLVDDPGFMEGTIVARQDARGQYPGRPDRSTGGEVWDIGPVDFMGRRIVREPKVVAVVEDEKDVDVRVEEDEELYVEQKRAQEENKDVDVGLGEDKELYVGEAPVDEEQQQEDVYNVREDKEQGEHEQVDIDGLWVLDDEARQSFTEFPLPPRGSWQGDADPRSLSEAAAEDMIQEVRAGEPGPSRSWQETKREDDLRSSK